MIINNRRALILTIYPKSKQKYIKNNWKPEQIHIVSILVSNYGRGRRTQPFAVPEIRLPSLSLGEFRPRHPLSARFFRFRGAHQRAPRHAPPAECSIINTVQKETSTATAVLVSLAGAEGLEPSARGFGERPPLC